METLRGKRRLEKQNKKKTMSCGINKQTNKPKSFFVINKYGEKVLLPVLASLLSVRANLIAFHDFALPPN